MWELRPVLTEFSPWSLWREGPDLIRGSALAKSPLPRGRVTMVDITSDNKTVSQGLYAVPGQGPIQPAMPIREPKSRAVPDIKGALSIPNGSELARGTLRILWHIRRIRSLDRANGRNDRCTGPESTIDYYRSIIDLYPKTTRDAESLSVNTAHSAFTGTRKWARLAPPRIPDLELVDDTPGDSRPYWRH
ncbi:MAG: hypothetical protein ACRD7E_29105 [Bryobacteraceae bacterium]